MNTFLKIVFVLSILDSAPKGVKYRLCLRLITQVKPEVVLLLHLYQAYLEYRIYTNIMPTLDISESAYEIDSSPSPTASKNGILTHKADLIGKKTVWAQSSFCSGFISRIQEKPET